MSEPKYDKAKCSKALPTDCGPYHAMTIIHSDSAEASEHDPHLFYEALEVLHETGLTPRELVERIKLAANGLEEALSEYESCDVISGVQEVLEGLQAAIPTQRKAGEG